MLFEMYAKLFAKPCYRKLNILLYNLSLRGLGVLNYRNIRETGEEWLISKLQDYGALDIVIDVGANEGEFSIEVFNKNPNSFIVAIEPHPVTFLRLKEALNEYRSICLENIALGNMSDEIDLYDYGDNEVGTSHASLYAEVFSQVYNSTCLPQRFRVRINKLDDLLCKYNISNKIDLLKIDVEGHEKAVLEGSRTTINKTNVRYILFEFNEMNVTSKTYLHDFIELLPKYDLYRLLPNGLFPLFPYKAWLH